MFSYLIHSINLCKSLDLIKRELLIDQVAYLKENYFKDPDEHFRRTIPLSFSHRHIHHHNTKKICVELLLLFQGKYMPI